MPNSNPHPAAAKTRNAVEKRLAQLHDLWWEQTRHPQLRAIVLRAPAHSQRMIEAFFALQQVDSEFSTPDLFVRFDAAFETGFSYSRELRRTLVDAYEHNKAQFAEQGVTAAWADASRPGFDSAAGFVETCQSLARHLNRQVISAVLQPRRIGARECFERWFDAAMQVPVAPADTGLLRLVLLDDDDTRAWQPLVERHGSHVTVVHAPVDVMDAAREVAAQSGAGGRAQVLYRQMYADLLTLLYRGDASAVELKARAATQLAVREGWSDQRSVIDTVVGSAWMQARDYPRSIERYRAARSAAVEAERMGSPMGRTLVAQTWLAEGAAWVAAGDMAQGARTFEQAAEAAKRVPHALFAIESHRSAAQCWSACGQRDKALNAAMLGVREARQMPDEDRAASTVPQLLNDLLRIHDPRRCELIARRAAHYEAGVLRAQADADRSAHRLGPHPDGQALEPIESRLLQSYEQAFQSLLQDRERLVAGGSEVFRTVVALGRQWLHPTWAGLPDVRHPLDLEPGEWRNAPAFAQLPDPQPMLDAA